MADRRRVTSPLALPTLAIVVLAVTARGTSRSPEAGGFDRAARSSAVLFLADELLIYAGATMLSYLAHAPWPRAAAPRRAPTPASCRRRRPARRRWRRVPKPDGAPPRPSASYEAGRVAAADAEEIRSDDEQRWRSTAR